jgi:hypothetical protein
MTPILLHAIGDSKFYLLKAEWKPNPYIIARTLKDEFFSWTYADTTYFRSGPEYNAHKADYDIAIEKAQQYLLLQ